MPISGERHIEKIIFQDSPVILKHLLPNYKRILKKCFLDTTWTVVDGLNVIRHEKHFLEILKQTLQNFSKILKKCSVTICVVMLFRDCHLQLVSDIVTLFTAVT